MSVSCPKCKGEDSFRHSLECAGLEVPPADDESLILEFLRHVAVKAMGGNPGLPTPIVRILEEGGIELARSSSPKDEISF